MANAGSEYWQKKVTSHWPLLNRLANRRFANSNTADEALLYAMDKLEEDDWRRVRAYEGRALFSTYLSVVATRLLEEFSKKKNGYLRPPEWLKRMGSLWVTVFKLLCGQRMSRTDVIEYLKGNAHGDQDLTMIEEAVEVIPSRIVNCGEYRGDQLSMETEDLDNLQDKGSTAQHVTPEDVTLAGERADLMILLSGFLDMPPGGTHTDKTIKNGKIRVMVDEFQARISFTAEERLLLKLIYQNGLKVSPAGRKLGLNTHQVQGRHRRLIEKIRRAFSESSIENELSALLE